MFGPVVTANLWKSVGISALAIIVCLMPFFWTFFDVVFDSSATMERQVVLVRCMDEWLLGNLAAGVAAVVNWLESKIDFGLDQFSDFLSVFAGIGALLALVIYVGLHGRDEEVLYHFVTLTEWLYRMGVMILLATFFSVCQCRRAKDMSVYVRI